MLDSVETELKCLAMNLEVLSLYSVVRLASRLSG